MVSSTIFSIFTNKSIITIGGAFAIIANVKQKLNEWFPRTVKGIT